MDSLNHQINRLYFNWKKQYPEKIQELPPSGSKRKYLRIYDNGYSYIAAFNDNFKENRAFISFSRHFHSKGLNVPKLYAEELDNHIYIQEDLGDQTLYNYLTEIREGNEFPQELIDFYKLALTGLIRFQLDGHQGIDYFHAYPRAKFDRQSMLWDLNYFKHYFIKLAGINFHEQNLEDDFHTLINYLLDTETNFFMYRDFQSRNIMLKDGDLFFIDYQGGRQGALQYDLASILYDAKADIPNNIRLELFDFYMNEIGKRKSVDQKNFTAIYYAYVLIRIMQAFGAYGYRGFFERKQHFLLSIPYAVNNLKWILEHQKIKIKLPALSNIFDQIIDSPNLKEFEYIKKPGLTVLINSFSYKRSIPLDNSGNGGGFVFDCRFLPNPGREEKYKALTGLDQEVVEYFKKYQEVENFIDASFQMVEKAIDNYLRRNFSNLMISFGCTGGQHRSVYCASRLAERINNRYQLNVELRHIEQEIKKQPGR